MLVKSLDSAVWEVTEAMDGLPDADVWQRPDLRLWSIGELAAHLCYWEAQSFFGDSFTSPLADARARYYDGESQQPFALSMGTQELHAELKRVHEACRAALLEMAPSLDDQNPHRPEWTWIQTLMYQTFHFGYHVGQMFSVRHLLGHQTPDN